MKTSRTAVSRESETFADALHAAVEEIKARRRVRGISLFRKYILFVPDKYTLSAEKLLYGDNAGAFDAEVLTINRLYYRLADAADTPFTEKPLSRLGAVLTVRRILDEESDSLRYCKRSARFPGFGEILYDNICQLSSCGLQAEDLPDTAPGAAGEKMRDVKRIYARFTEETRGKYVDAAGRLVLLEKLLAAGTDYFANTDVFFACFDGCTPILNRIIQKICALCGEDRAAVYSARCKLNVRGKSVDLYEATNRAEELKAVAVQIKAAAADGVPFGDMGVIAPGAEFNRLKRIFGEYEIPFFTDVKYALSSHPLSRYLTDIMRAAHAGTNENYIRLSKNPYAGVAPMQADLFENYVIGCALGEGSMSRPFAFEPTDPALVGTLPAAEAVRAHLFAAVQKVRKREIRNGTDFCRALMNAIPVEADRVTESLTAAEELRGAGAFGGLFPGVREEIASAVSVLEDVFPHPVRFEVLLSALKECFALKEVGVIPNRTNTVEGGDGSAFRTSRKTHLFVLDAHEGEVPLVRHDDGFLSDRDLAILAADGKTRIEPSIETLNDRAEEELYSVLSSSEHLHFSYCADETPSPVIERVVRACGATVCKETPERTRLRLLGMGDDKAGDAALLTRLCPTRAAALEWYWVGRSDTAAGGAGIGFEPELFAALGGVPAEAQREPTVRGVRRLYSSSSISVSRVQSYFACPLRCFLRYGLRLRPRPDGEVSAVDLGTFLHRVIELFIRGGVFDRPRDTIPALVERIRAEEPQLLCGADVAFIAELTDEAIEVASAAVAQLEKGAFRPVFTEIPFGTADAQGEERERLRGREICLSDGSRLTVSGCIDRIDAADCGDKRAARIIDYKTGYAEFEYADVYYGKKIQPAIYLRVAEENGYAPAGLFYFPFSSGFSQEKNNHRLRGIFDEAYAAEMDAGLGTPGYGSDAVPACAAKDSAPGHVVLKKTGGAVSADVLKGVCDYAEKVLTAGAEEMLSGYCAPSPLQTGQTTECAYCEMRPVCAALGGKRNVRKRGRVRKAFFAQQTEEERP